MAAVSIDINTDAQWQWMNCIFLLKHKGVCAVYSQRSVDAFFYSVSRSDEVHPQELEGL